MNTPAGRLMKCFLRDLYMVIFFLTKYKIYPNMFALGKY